MKVGDKLYCHNNKQINYDNIQYKFNYTIGECYVINYISFLKKSPSNYSYFGVINDLKLMCYFNIDLNDKGENYKKWFYTEVEMRKLKLKKLNENK